MSRPSDQAKRAVFLDRDGVLIEERHYLHKIEDVVIFPGTGRALRSLQEAGFLLFVVTNQSGIGRGYFSEQEMHAVHDHIRAELAKDGVRFTKFYHAPEAPDQPSRGRKPSPEFLLDAQREFHVDLSSSYMVGDKLVDLECGWNAKVKTCFLVRTGYGAEVEQKSPERLKNAPVVDHIVAAAEWILMENSA